MRGAGHEWVDVPMRRAVRIARRGVGRAFRPRLVMVGLASSAWLLLGCSPRTVPASVAVGRQGFYKTGFALNDVSEALEAILPSVVRIQVAGSYDVYVFDEADAPTDEEAHRAFASALLRASDVDTATTTHFATAVVLASRGGRGTLITTDHGANLPDTTVEYFEASRGSGRVQVIERFGILRRRTSTVVGATFVEPFDILARSESRDLALIGVEIGSGTGPGRLPALRIGPGSPSRLSWGSLVYVLGFPIGYQMVTRAVVSKPDMGQGSAFLTDALLNEGASGAPIVAIRGDSEELEWVGLARAAATRPELRLVPSPDAQGSQGFATPYDGPVYLRDMESIRYGITFSIPVDEVRAFVADQRSQLVDAGYPVPEL